MIASGDVLSIVHRRLYESDHSRFFVGRVEDYADGIVRICGYSFARDSVDGNLCRKDECHTRLFTISSGTLMMYMIPAEVDVEEIRMETNDAGLCLTDRREFCMNISEWIHQLGG